MLFIILSSSIGKKSAERGLSEADYNTADERTKAGLAEVRAKLGLDVEQTDEKKK